MPPSWLTALSVVFLVLAGLSALIVVIDLLAGRRQLMAVMNVAWPITALYFGPFGLWAYWALGRRSAVERAPAAAAMAMPMGGSMSMSGSMHMSDPSATKAPSDSARPFWQRVFVATTHCGSGCTLGDIIGEWAIFLLGFTIAGSVLLTQYAVDFALAFLLGVIFQFWAIMPMRHLKFRAGLREAAKADAISLTAFEVGLFAWMALMRFVFFDPPLQPNQVEYWFMMQVGMILGFFTSYPANWFLIRRGIKEAM